MGNIFSYKKRLEIRLEEIQVIGTNKVYSLNLKVEEGNIISKLEEREKHEEILWLQKCRNRCLNEGKQNT